MTSDRIRTACNTLLDRGTKPTIPEVEPLVEAFYALPGNGAGGVLHIVLDDGNVEDRFVESCIRSAQQRADVTGEALGRVLLLMSLTQRRKL